MDRKSKILILIFALVIVSTFLWKYHTILQKHDFIIDTHIACDSSVNVCFTTVCDVESGEDCTDAVYAKLQKRAIDIPLCDKFKDNCPELTCAIGEPDCSITYCSDESLDDGESCVGLNE